MSNQILQLKNNIKDEIISLANKEIAKIKLHYLIHKDLCIEYLPDNTLTNKLTALEVIDKEEFEKLISEIKNYKCEIFNKTYPLITYEHGFLNVITYIDIPF